MRITYTTLLLSTAFASRLLAQAGAVRLTVQDAQALALKNHPQVLAAQNAASAQTQRIVEARSAYLPTVNGFATGSQGNIGARIGAGFLSVSRLFNRYGQGIEINQLITDAGRTANLLAQSKLQASAAEQTYQATRYDVLLAVNQAYFGALRAQALVRVAQETVAARQLVVDQVSALARNNLRSQLDVGFANVNRSQAQLLLIRSQDELQRAFADLTRALGAQQPATYQLVEEPLPPSPPPAVEDLVAQALRDRPEAASLRLSRDAAYRFEEAEKDLKRPSASFVAVGGYMPYVDQITLPRVIPKEYEGAAINLTVPIFNGRLFTARREAAHYQALEADQRVRDMEQAIARDVRAAAASAMTAYQQLDVTAELLREATLAADLAKGRYDLGLSSIIELTQAQLNLTQAAIENLSAKYEYQAEHAALQFAIGALR